MENIWKKSIHNELYPLKIDSLPLINMNINKNYIKT